MLSSVRFLANPILGGRPTYDHLLNSSKLFALYSQKRGRTWVKVTSLPYLWPALAIFLTPLMPLRYHSISGREHLQDPLANRWILYFTTKKQKEYVTGEFNDILDEGKNALISEGKSWWSPPFLMFVEAFRQMRQVLSLTLGSGPHHLLTSGLFTVLGLVLTSTQTSFGKSTHFLNMAKSDQYFFSLINTVKRMTIPWGDQRRHYPRHWVTQALRDQVARLVGHLLHELKRRKNARKCFFTIWKRKLDSIWASYWQLWWMVPSSITNNLGLRCR